MSDRSLIVLSRWLAGLTLACGAATVAVLVWSGSFGEAPDTIWQPLTGTVIGPVIILLAIPRVPRNGSVWAFGVVGLSLGLEVLGDSVAVVVSGISSVELNLLIEGINVLPPGLAPADLPMTAAFGLSLAMSMWIPSFVLIPTMVLLLFPDGRFPRPQRWWRWIGTIIIPTTAIGVLLSMWLYRPWSTTSYAELSESSGWLGAATGLLTMLWILLAVVSIVGYAVKWKRSSGPSRLQYRWVGSAFFAFAIVSLGNIFLGGFDETRISDIVAWTTIAVIPIAYTVAIMKYRLYGINTVVSKTVTYGSLAVFITGVYVLVVVGIGSWVGSGSDLALSIAAVAIVAVAFEPLRVRVQHWANRLVYGRRATPYEVLASVTARLSESADSDDTLREVTRLVADGTGASMVVLWLVVGDHLYPRVSTPAEAIDRLSAVPASGAGFEDVAADRTVAVRHRGDVLGALSITKDRGDAVTGADDDVLEDVAAGAGVLLRNIGLNAELAERADQLRISRRRLVAAQDAERHRLERDLHDGAQQQVVALKVKLGIARTIAEREGADEVAELVASIADTTQAAVDSMRAVAHGIYPPLLEAEGLETALIAAKRTVPIPVEVVATGVERYDRPTEESGYFAILGIIAAAVTAGATRAVISLNGSEQSIRFKVDVDEPPGDLVAVTDRINAVDGSINITAKHDTTIVGVDLPTNSMLLEHA